MTKKNYVKPEVICEREIEALAGERPTVPAKD